MDPVAAQPCGFNDLPLEIRSEIYREVFCPCKAQINQRRWKGYALDTKKHSIDTGLLFVNKRIHIEALDFMIKTYQFILVKGENVNIMSMIIAGKIPVVALNKRGSKHRIDTFLGYVMTVTFTVRQKRCQPEHYHDKVDSSCMILAQDFPALCNVWDHRRSEFIGPDNRSGWKASITAAAGGPGPIYPDVIEFLSVEKRQHALVAPLFTYLDPYEWQGKISITGFTAANIDKTSAIRDVVRPWVPTKEPASKFNYKMWNERRTVQKWGMWRLPLKTGPLRENVIRRFFDWVGLTKSRQSPWKLSSPSSPLVWDDASYLYQSFCLPEIGRDVFARYGFSISSSDNRREIASLERLYHKR